LIVILGGDGRGGVGGCDTDEEEDEWSEERDVYDEV
jgi:hypothetical protein